VLSRQLAPTFAPLPEPLETVDLPGVEILATGGPVHGVGSPPEGDFWTTAQLEGIAAANRELVDQVKAAGKIGHSTEQILAGIKEGELPAVGWLDGSTFRVSDDGTKLFADAKAVPARTAQLIESGAYRTRSAELSRVTDQKTGKVHDWAVTGLAWLGGKMPAVQTLDDVVALYESAGLDKPDARVFVVYAADATMPDGVTKCSMKGVSGFSGGDLCHVHDGTDAGMATAMGKAKADAAKTRKNALGTVVWEPEAGFSDLRDDVSEAVNGPYTGGTPRFWVSDIAVSGDKALVSDYSDGNDGWVVPFSRAADDTITVAAFADWIPVEQGWVEAAREMESARVSSFTGRADIRRRMPETKYTDAQRLAFVKQYEALAGTPLDDPAKVTDEMLAAAGVAVEEPKVDGPPKTEPKVELEADERFRQFETRINEADERARKLEAQLATKDRDHFVDAVLREGKDEPGQREHIEKFYETDPELARAFYANRRPDETLAREYGADSDVTAEELEAENKQYEAETAARLGIPAGQVL
jgi:hypothetical protein